MRSFFRSLVVRFKNLFITHAAMDLEAEMITHEAERCADLHRRADSYEKEGLGGIAHFLRKQAETLTAERPLAGVLVTAQHFYDTAETPRLALASPDSQRQRELVPAQGNKRDKRRRR